MTRIEEQAVSTAWANRDIEAYIWVSPSGYVSVQDGWPMDKRYSWFPIAHLVEHKFHPDWRVTEEFAELEANLTAAA